MEERGFLCVEVCKEEKREFPWPCGLKALGKAALGVQFLPWIQVMKWFIKDFPIEGKMVSGGV